MIPIGTLRPRRRAVSPYDQTDYDYDDDEVEDGASRLIETPQEALWGLLRRESYGIAKRFVPEMPLKASRKWLVENCCTLPSARPMLPWSW